jgi:hypothetical protein
MRIYLKQVDTFIVRMTPPHIMPLSTLREDLLCLGQVAEIGQLHLCGEPLAHPDIDEIIAMARSTNVAGSVCVETNGQLLHRMTDRFWRAIRKLDVHVVPGKLSGAQIVAIQNKAREHKVDLSILPVVGPVAIRREDVMIIDCGKLLSFDGALELEGITMEKLRGYLG